ncbi:MAG: hypothetical protein KC435_05240 [Thermomicrobiales bacterium]|nr:hypothetical protein [Thermomicrobiales bacterium]
MRKAHHLLQAALVFVMLASAFSPLVSVAQEATPTVEEDSSAPVATGEPDTTDLIVADPDSSTVETDEGTQNLSPLAEPPLEISINGETEHVILPGGDQTVIPEIPNGAEWRMYPGANCTGGSPNDVWLSAGFGFIWHTPGDFWLQARWENDHTVLSNCLRVTITNIPVMTVAGATSATAVVSGSSFKASSSAGSEWSAFPNATCTEDVAQAWFTSERTLEAPEPGVWSFRARLTADNTVTSACIPVTFVNLPTLTANGSFVSIAVPIDTSVWVAASSDASWYYYWSADCSGGPAGGDNGGFSWYQYAPKTMSFQPYLRAYPSIVGKCVTVTWREATPTVSVNGATDIAYMQDGTQTHLTFPVGAEVAIFANTTCSGSTIYPWTTSTAGWQGYTLSMSVQARWIGDDSTRGNCVIVHWVPSPPLTVNGSSGPLTLSPNANATPELPDGAQWRAYTGENCTGEPVTEWSATASASANVDTTWSFQARWSTNDATYSNCVTVTWQAATPTTIVNGRSTSFVVPIGTTLYTEYVSGAESGLFVGDACVGNPVTGWGATTGFEMSAEYVISFVLRWYGDDSTRGNCVTVRGASSPQITVNGSSDALTLNPNAPATPTFPDGAQWRAYEGAECTGNPGTEWSATASAQTDVDTTWSFQARWGTDDATAGNCVNVTWREATPTVSVNGHTTSFTVPVGTTVNTGEISDAEAGMFEGNSCEGDSEGWSATQGTRMVSPGVYSFQARWAGDDSTRGNCVTVTWEPVSVPVLASIVCGNDNDVITAPMVQTGITVSDSGWLGNHRTVTLSAVDGYTFPVEQQTVFEFTDDGLCVTDAPIPPVQTALCGTNNDTVTVPDQPANVLVSDTGWVNGERTITFSAAADYALPTGTQTEYIFTDAGLCETAAPIPPTQSAVCGVNNDIVTVSDQPANVLVSDTDWVNGERTIIFSAAADYVLPTGTQTEYVFTDLGLCETAAPIPPVQTAVCGTNNDTVTVPDQPANVLVSDTDWVNGQRTITFSAAADHVLPSGTQTEYVFIDAGLCETAAPIPPTQSAVCGIDNDTVSIPDQPANVLVSDTGWVNGERIITFSAADDYVLPTGTQTEYVFIDEGPCVADSVNVPVQTAVCGPDNDSIDIPEDQPVGISFGEDSGWIGNQRIISFDVDPNYTATGETTFTFVDDGTACPPATSQVDILLVISDGGSVVGAPYELYAPTASLAAQSSPYLQGTIGEGNTIDLGEIMVGTYRLVVTASGYETLDTTFVVADEDTQTIELPLVALATATPSPATPTTTAEPATPTVTAEPSTPTSTAEPSSPTPVATTAVVSSLPNTGSGVDSVNMATLVLSATAAAFLLGVGLRRRAR